jgi:hypothetical protein
MNYRAMKELKSQSESSLRLFLITILSLLEAAALLARTSGNLGIS